MDANRKTLIRLSEDVRDGFGRVAAKGSFIKTQGGPPQFGEEGNPGNNPGNPFQKGGFGKDTTNARRQIPENHEFDKKAIKPIVKSLWAMSIALGHALTAHRQFSRLKSSTFSPDGLLGGRGYVMPIKDIRQQLFEACENLSGLVDTLHDEINAPHWKPKLADLEKADMAEVERLLSDAEEWIDNPEEEADEEERDVTDNASWNKDRFKRDQSIPRSDMPSGGDKETVQKSGPSPGSPDHPQNKYLKNASAYTYDRRPPEPKRVHAREFEGGKSLFLVEFPLSELTLSPKLLAEMRSARTRALWEAAFQQQGNSSQPTTTLPGPRVQHLDRADSDQTGPGGSVNREDRPVDDSWGETDGVSGQPMSQNTGDGNNYPSAWSGEFDTKDASRYDTYMPHTLLPDDPGRALGDRDKLRTETIEDEMDGEWRAAAEAFGSSGVPDSSSDSTPGQGYDFGIGDGNGNDAHGQAAGGYGEGNPGSPDSNPGGGTGNRGVNGPRADLPSDPGGGQPKDTGGDTNPMIEQGIGNNSVPARTASGKLPNDDEAPVARSDYYWGDKGNDFNYDKNHNAAPTEQAQSRTPGNEADNPPAPTSHRPMSLGEWEFSASPPADPLATSGMPGDQPGEPGGTYDSEPGYGVDEYHRTEQTDQPYIVYDDNTHNMKPDETYQRGDLPAPYVNQTTP